MLSAFPRLTAILKGVKRVQAQANSPARPRLPITPDILSIIQRLLPNDRAGHMIWAACLTGFFGFLRTAEYLQATSTTLLSTSHLLTFQWIATRTPRLSSSPSSRAKPTPSGRAWIYTWAKQLPISAQYPP